MVLEGTNIFDNLFKPSPEDGQVDAYTGPRVVPTDIPDTVTLTPLESALNVLELQAATAITPGVYQGVQMDIFSDADGYLNTIDTANTGAIFDTDKYTTETVGTEYVIIEATSLSAPWDANNCKTMQIDTGKWLVYCNTGTDAVKRAQIIKSLFNGTDGLILDFTGVTAVKTSHANDVGKQAHWAYCVGGTGILDVQTGDYTGTFADTTNNTDCSTWSSLFSEPWSNDSWQMPDGTVLNSSSDSTSDEFGTDRSADEKDNQAECQIYTYCRSYDHTWSRAIILCAGDISWVQTGTFYSVTNIDFFTDHSIPLMTAVDSGEWDGNFVVQTDAISIATGFNEFQVVAFRQSTTGTGTVTASISFDNGANYQTVAVNTNSVIENQGNDMIVKINLNAGATEGTAECKGWGVQLW